MSVATTLVWGHKKKRSVWNDKSVTKGNKRPSGRRAEWHVIY